MKTEGAHTVANGRIRRGLRFEPSLKGGGGGGGGAGAGGYGLTVDVEEKEVLPQSSSRICVG